MVFLHGFCHTRGMWAIIVPMLAEHYTVVCSDLRGYGASDKPKGIEQYSFSEIDIDQL